MDDLPAYGHLSANYAAELDRKALYVPLDWGIGRRERDPQGSWERWKREIIESLDALWPAFRLDTDKTRASRAKRRLALTSHDLELMRSEFVSCMDARVVAPDSIDEREHWELYELEDVLEPPRDPADTLPFYAPRIAGMLGDRYVGSIATGRARKLGTLLLQLKVQFERPRAFQTAFLMNPDIEFKHEYAASGCTPSFTSAHCLQALMGTVYLYERLMVSGVTIPESTTQSLQQYAADVGDRRVFAGVHYPSDSLGSWLVATALASHVFPSTSSKRALKFISDSIRRSLVHRVLSTDTNPTISEAVAKLEKQLAH